MEREAGPRLDTEAGGGAGNVSRQPGARADDPCPGHCASRIRQRSESASGSGKALERVPALSYRRPGNGADRAHQKPTAGTHPLERGEIRSQEPEVRMTARSAAACFYSDF